MNTKIVHEEINQYLENTDEEDFSGKSDEDFSDDDNESEDMEKIETVENKSNKVNLQALEVPTLSNATNFQWKSDILKLEQETFTGYHGVQNIEAITEDGRISLNKIYAYFLTDDLIDEMVFQTNNYAHLLKKGRTAELSRMTEWKDVSREELKLFFGVIMYMGLDSRPSIEHYWKLDTLYYNPLMHKINMSYNRFISILRCWHFTEIQIGVTGEQRTHKINPLIHKVIHNFRSLYIPSKVIVVDKSILKIHGKLNIKTKKVCKACAINGYTWSYHICEGLQQPESIVVYLTESLLDEGRIIAADDYYTSLSLAEYLKNRKTDLCGTLRKNKRNLPEEVLKANLVNGEKVARQKDNLYTVLKWRDERDILMISTCHGDGMSKVHTKRGDVMKPDVLIDFDKARQRIDITHQLASIHSPLSKSLAWYKKIAVDLLFRVAIVNTKCIYNELVEGPKLTVLQVQEHLVRHFLGPAASTTKQNFPQRSSISSSTSGTSIPYSGHFLEEIPRNEHNRLVRRRCSGCYVKLKIEGLMAKRAKQVHTECKMCKKAFCLPCFNEKHA